MCRPSFDASAACQANWQPRCTARTRRSSVDLSAIRLTVPCLAWRKAPYGLGVSRAWQCKGACVWQRMRPPPHSGACACRLFPPPPPRAHAPAASFRCMRLPALVSTFWRMRLATPFQRMLLPALVALFWCILRRLTV
eukprot:365319-Chlamydomonas_euryale.AAC.12